MPRKQAKPTPDLLLVYALRLTAADVELVQRAARARGAKYVRRYAREALIRAVRSDVRKAERKASVAA